MATTEKEMVVRAGRPEEAAAEAPAKPAMVTAVTADELDVRMEGPKVDVPGEIEERAQAWMDDYRAKLTAQTENYLEELEGSKRRRQSGSRAPRVRVLGPAHDLPHSVHGVAALSTQQDHREQRARALSGGAVHQPGDEHLQPHLRHHDSGAGTCRKCDSSK